MYKLKTTLLFLILIILVNGSCRNLFRKDPSLSIKEYEANGMPDIKKPWSEHDLMNAHGAIASVRKKNFYTMPVSGSRKSGAVFSRIISSENLNFLDDKSKPLHDMAYEIQTTISFLNDIGRMYTDNLHPKQYYSEELIKIFICQIDVREKMLMLAERIMNSKDPEDISMQPGRKAIVVGYVNLITTLIRNQEKTHSFSRRDLKRLNNAVTKSVIKNIKVLDPEGKQKISNEIISICEKSPSGYNNKSLKDLLKIVKE